MFMLFLLTGMVSFSFAATPDWAACNYAYNITYYDSPSNAGTINGYSNGQTQQIQHNRVPCQDYELYSSAQATPLSGYLFSSWSSSSSISLSSTSANPTGFKMGPGSGSITANYVAKPDFMNEYLSKSSNGSYQTLSPPTTNQVDKALSESGFQNSTYYTYSPYSITKISKGTYNNTNVVDIYYIQDNGTYSGDSFTGNVTVGLSLVQNESDPSSYYLGAVSSNFAPLTGNGINGGDLPSVDFSTTVYNMLG